MASDPAMPSYVGALLKRVEEIDRGNVFPDPATGKLKPEDLAELPEEERALPLVTQRQHLARRRRTAFRKQLILEEAGKIIAELDQQANGSADFSKLAVAARLGFKLMCAAGRMKEVIALYSELRKMYGHDSKTLVLKQELPTQATLEKWKKQAEKYGVVLEGSFSATSLKAVEDGSQPSHD